MRYEIGNSGRFIDPRAFWALVDARRRDGNRMSYVLGGFRALDGTWYFRESMPAVKRRRCHDEWRRNQWWVEHKRDTSVIAGLSDADLKLFGLLADIRADHRVLAQADGELRRRSIRDYPIAI
jgi:hypothetical protein